MEEITKIRNAYFKLRGGFFNFKGSSMKPTLKEGDVLQVAPVNKSNVRAGDIVIFERRVLTCHRVLGRFKKDNRLCFLEKGDNSNSAGHIFYEDIVGKVKYIVTKDGLKRPVFHARGKIALLFIIDFFMAFYIELADFLKSRLFLKRNNIFFKILGTIIWRVYYFYFKLILKSFDAKMFLTAE